MHRACNESYVVPAPYCYRTREEQSEALECGLACLAMISSYHGHRIDLNTLRRRYPVSIIQVANQMQLTGRPLRFELTQV